MYVWERPDWPQQVAAMTPAEKKELETLLALRPGVVDDPGELREAFRALVGLLKGILEVLRHPREVAAEAVLLGRIASKSGWN